MKKAVTIIDALHHPKIWATPAWRPDPSTQVAWDTFHKAVHGLPMTDAELEIYRQCTGRQTPHPQGHEEVVAPISRRGGKTLNMSKEAVYLACFREWAGVPGERKVVLICSSTTKQARNAYSYCRALIAGVPALKAMLVRETAGELELSNGITIEIVVNDYRSIRGATIVAVIADEIAFWDVDGSNPDAEVLAAIRPGMASVKGSMLFIVSSPYAKRGELWRLYDTHWGVETSRILVWNAPTRVMNPTIAQEFIDEEMERDPARCRSEYLGEFRDDVISFVPPEMVRAAVVIDRKEIPPGPGLTNLSAMIDAAGGNGQDSYAMAISGKDPESGKVVLICVREVKPRFSPEQVTKEFAEVLRSYGLFEATADRFGGGWPREAFEAHGISLIPAKPSSEIFVDFLPLLMSRRVELLDDKTVVSQLIGLDRKTGRGRDYISAGGNGHDDVAVVVAGSLLAASRPGFEAPIIIPYVADRPVPDRWRGDLDAWSGGYGGGGSIGAPQAADFVYWTPKGNW